MTSEKTLWKLKKWNSLTLVILVLIQAHFLIGHYYSDGSLTYSVVKNLYSKTSLKIFSTLFNTAIAIHIYTALNSVFRFYIDDQKKRERINKLLLTILIVLLSLFTVPVWRLNVS